MGWTLKGFVIKGLNILRSLPFLDLQQAHNDCLIHGIFSGEKHFFLSSISYIFTFNCKEIFIAGFRKSVFTTAVTFLPWFTTDLCILECFGVLVKGIFSTIGICLQSCWFYVSLLMEIVDEFLNFFYIQVDVRKKIKMLWENTFLSFSLTFRIPKIELIFFLSRLLNREHYSLRIFLLVAFRTSGMNICEARRKILNNCAASKDFYVEHDSVTSQLQEGVTSMKMKQIFIWKKNREFHKKLGCCSE